MIDLSRRVSSRAIKTACSHPGGLALIGLPPRLPLKSHRWLRERGRSHAMGLISNTCDAQMSEIAGHAGKYK